MKRKQTHTNAEAGETSVSRRDFVRTAAAATAAVPFLGEGALAARTAQVSGKDELRVGLIGCGGRGTGAAVNSIDAADRVRLVAMADVFPDRLKSSRSNLEQHNSEKATVSDDMCFVGFDAYRQLLEHADVDLVILATPPHFRPMQLQAAIEAGKHVFMEKPVAVDPVGVRTVIAAGGVAQRRGLGIVAGTQRRHELCYLDVMKRIEDGLIGDVVAARCYWNQQGLWHKDPQPEWSDMEWQLRNWLYFTWLSGDHICEQHIHNLDVINWAMGGPPTKALGLGGRETRTDPVFGQIFDHHAIEYEYPDGRFCMSMCRQMDGCESRVEEVINGTKGRSITSSNRARIIGETDWSFSGKNPNPYVQEHKDLISSIENGTPLNEAKRVAESTLTAIMGRMATYTGKSVTWDFAMNESKLDLTPPAYEFGPMPMPPVAVPGRTPLV
ncbi:MAG: gfo/Idh/MocA family oxidoreductase [Planctomycetes bacterium]|nr:gfo/Idh/MocA family oxidoreductase [Planctomycetota bacterium]NOG55724.1 Gfo/Idh/MocA family oxidoreductase [Planctomycetota bacterium]